MRILFFILALSILFFSTQPVWGTLLVQLQADCRGGVCEVPQGACEEAQWPDANKAQSCCPAFQCCFIAFPGFSIPYSLDLPEISKTKNRPAENTNKLFSQDLADYFHPPDVLPFSHYC